MIDHLPALWQPKIGQRVVCRPSPECAMFQKMWSYDGKGPVSNEWKGHLQPEQGRTGRIHAVLNARDYVTNPSPEAVHHRYEVDFDGPFYYSGMEIVSCVYHAAELSPVFALGDRVRIRQAIRYCPEHHLIHADDVGTIIDSSHGESGHVWTVRTDDGDGVYRVSQTEELSEEEMIPE